MFELVRPVLLDLGDEGAIVRPASADRFEHAIDRV